MTKSPRWAELKPAQRSDFLARYARIIQHYDLVKPSKQARAGGTESAVDYGLKPRPKTVPVTKSAVKREFSGSAASESLRSPVALTTGGAVKGDEPTIGFAELLFRNADNEPSPPDAPTGRVPRPVRRPRCLPISFHLMTCPCG